MSSDPTLASFAFLFKQGLVWFDSFSFHSWDIFLFMWMKGNLLWHL